MILVFHFLKGITGKSDNFPLPLKLEIRSRNKDIADIEVSFKYKEKLLDGKICTTIFLWMLWIFSSGSFLTQSVPYNSTMVFIHNCKIILLFIRMNRV